MHHKGMSYDFVKDQMFKKYFEMMPLDSLQGTSFMDGDLLLLDEAQLCSVSILSVILSRFGKGSKLIMTGDLGQVYNVIPPSENGLLKLLRLLPSKHIAYVKLQNNYRSGLVELAEGLQDKSF
jgi:predicted ribonuclease YlaK